MQHAAASRFTLHAASPSLAACCACRWDLLPEHVLVAVAMRVGSTLAGARAMRGVCTSWAQAIAQVRGSGRGEHGKHGTALTTKHSPPPVARCAAACALQYPHSRPPAAAWPAVGTPGPEAPPALSAACRLHLQGLKNLVLTEDQLPSAQRYPNITRLRVLPAADAEWSERLSPAQAAAAILQLSPQHLPRLLHLEIGHWDDRPISTAILSSFGVISEQLTRLTCLMVRPLGLSSSVGMRHGVGTPPRLTPRPHPAGAHERQPAGRAAPAARLPGLAGALRARPAGAEVPRIRAAGDAAALAGSPERPDGAAQPQPGAV